MKKRAKKSTRRGSRSYWIELLALCALLTVAVALWNTSPKQRQPQPQPAVSSPAKKAEPRKALAARQESPQPKNAQKSERPSAQNPGKQEQRKKDQAQQQAPAVATASVAVSREEYTVAGVPDGDTLELRDSRGNRLRVRLYGIDAPEGKQSLGNESRDNIARMVKGKKVMIKRLYTDNYQRSVSIVYLSEGGRPDALSLNERQIQDGMAWVYDFFCTSQECNTWKFEEAMAKTRRIGIWKNPAPTPPWQWRALQGD